MFNIKMTSHTWLFFFFKQKTAYEMRISDWSSDVCSSDLVIEFEQPSSFLRTRHSRAAASWQRQAMIVDFVFSSCRIGCDRTKRSLSSADASASKAPERRTRGVCFHVIFLALERPLTRGHEIPGPHPTLTIHFSHSPHPTS